MTSSPARHEAVEWKTRGHDLPADLTDRLRAAGFVPEDRETILVGLAADMAADPVLPDGVSLVRVTDEAGFRAIAAMESEVWGHDSSFLADDLTQRSAAAPDDIAVFAVRDVTGQVVSAAWIVFYPETDFAGLWGGSTLAAWRKHGIYRALIAARAQSGGRARASATCRSTPPTIAPRSCAALASSRSPRLPRTCGRRSTLATERMLPEG